MTTQQVQMIPGPGPVQKFGFWYEGTDTLLGGYLLCANTDANKAANSDVTPATDVQTSADANEERVNRVEKPATGNLNAFAGVVAEGQENLDGPCEVQLIVPMKALSSCNIYTTEACTAGTTLLSVVAGSYIAGGIGEGPIIAKALQTVDRSTTNGLVQARVLGLSRAMQIDTSTLAGDGPSPIIWQNCPWEEIGEDPTLGYRFFDDFLNPLNMADATANGGYYTKQDTGVTILAQEDADERGGLLEIANNDDDVDFGHFFLSNGVLHNLCWIADGTTWAPFWFEARLKVEVVSSTPKLGLFVGLGGIGLSDDAGLVIDTGAVKDEDHIGFEVLCATPTSIAPVFKATGQTKANGTAVTIASDTYFKVGIWGNGTTITSYINGVSKHAITAALITGATFPNDVALTMALMTQTGEASESAVKMDWWRFAQLRI